MNVRKSFLAFALAACCGLAAQAQKIGYVNSQAILSELPAMKAAESDLVAFRDQKQNLLQTKAQAAQAEYQDLVQRQQAGELTPKQIQEGEASLQAKQQELAEMEASIQEDLMKRREQKLQPILNQVNTAIETVAKDEGYTYVFDAVPGGVIVYAEASMDLTEAVRAKLAAMN